MLRSPPANATGDVPPSTSVHGTPVSASDASITGTAPIDAESRAWVDRLDPESSDREAAIEALHALLLKGARFEVNRRRAAFPHLRGDDHDDLAQQSADDALVAVLSKLGDFRGLQVRPLRGGGNGPPARLAGTRAAARAGELGPDRRP